MPLQRSEVVDWTQCSSEKCWFYYLLVSGFDHDVPASFFDTRKRDTRCTIISGRALPVHADLSAVSTGLRAWSNDQRC